jgi:signal transduction histidine kinase
MRLVPTDLRDVVEEVRQRYAGHGIDLRVAQADRPIVVVLDAPRLDQVLDNLVDNALKYGAAGQPPELVVDADGDEARVTVIDHGIGIPEEERGRVFERFFRASNAHSITDTGIGLGLSICRRIVEEHGGTIGFEPTPGGGSTFSVRLPLAQSPASEGSDELAPSLLADARPGDLDLSAGAMADA